LTKTLQNLIKNSSKEGDIVLDCFMGSGTTAIACKDTNRQFVGFEIAPKWVKVGNDRLDNIDANGQMSMFLR
jgi:site-specific DNA-methyltransferase (adenine-specific)